MKSYDTLTEAVNDLRKRGFTLDFNLEETAIGCKEHDFRLKPDEFHIREFYRFEGESNPSDEEVVYAIESDDGKKGGLVDAFGTYSGSLSDEMLARLERK